MVFQIHHICNQRSDKSILEAIQGLPRDLPKTFDRILRKLSETEEAEPELARQIYNWLAVAKRPLTLEELREAVAINPSKSDLDAR